jgi:hypothetical protein
MDDDQKGGRQFVSQLDRCVVLEVLTCRIFRRERSFADRFIKLRLGCESMFISMTTDALAGTCPAQVESLEFGCTTNCM